MNSLEWTCKVCSSKNKSTYKFLCNCCYHKKLYRTNLIYRNKMIKRAKDYSKRTGYAYDKTPARRVKAKIRWDLRNKIKSGKIKRDPCSNCGSSLNLQFHHPDYNKPEVYMSICKDCHLKEHDLIGYKLPIKELQGGIS